MSEQREAIAIALVKGLVDVWQSDDTVVVHADHIDPAVNEIVAHIWSRADDPAVVEAVGRAIADKMDYQDYLDTFGDSEAKNAIAATLTALLGTRPSDLMPDRAGNGGADANE